MSFKAEFAANGYEAHSSGGYSLFVALVYEIVMIYLILVVILGGRRSWTSAVGFAD